jgi:hypothetical protein
LGTVERAVNELGELPASSCQEATSVAPFQLVNTVMLEPLRLATIVGDVVGCPLQEER